MEIEELKKYTVADRQFELVALNKNGAKERYAGKFCQSQNDHYLISILRDNNKTVTLKAGQEVNIHLYTPEGVYNLSCKILEVYEKYYKISLPKTIKRAQRREFIRVNMRIPMKIIVGDTQKRVYDVISNNISARGCGFYCKDEIGAQEKITVQFSIDGKPIQTFANLVSCKPKPLISGVGRHTVSLYFTSVSQSNIDLIVKECFTFQGKARLQMLNSRYENT